MLEAVFNLTAKDSPTKLVRREVDLLTQIEVCSQKNGETVATYAPRFNNVVAQYVNQTTSLSDASSRQLALLMLRNALLSTDTLNTLIFRLTAISKTTVTASSEEIILNIDEAGFLLDTFNTVSTDDTLNEHVTKKIEKLVNGMDTTLTDKDPMFELDDAT